MTCYAPANTAAWRRPLEPGQYTAIRFTQRLDDAGIRPSMGSVGDSFDTQSRISVRSVASGSDPSFEWPGVEMAGGGLRHDGRGRRLGV
jgi:hypothetical protein